MGAWGKDLPALEKGEFLSISAPLMPVLWESQTGWCDVTEEDPIPETPPFFPTMLLLRPGLWGGAVGCVPSRKSHLHSSLSSVTYWVGDFQQFPDLFDLLSLSLSGKNSFLFS